jgi:hypothetical protein
MIKKLLIAADLGHLKVFNLTEGQPFVRPRSSLVEQSSTDVINHISEVVTDRAGQYRRGTMNAGSSDQSDGEEHNLSLERRKRALKYLAARICKLVDQAGVEYWYLAAASEINRALIAALDAVTRAKLERNVPANLTKLGVQQVLNHFNGAVPAALKRAKKDAATLNAQTGEPEEDRADVATVASRRPNARRKPAARRTSPFKQMMRKQKIGPQLAARMEKHREKGDRRRTAAQREVTNRARARVVTEAEQGARSERLRRKATT